MNEGFVKEKPKTTPEPVAFHGEGVLAEDMREEVLNVELIREVGLDDLESHQYLYSYIRQQGWKIFFNEVQKDPFENLDILQYCLRRFGDFSKLSDETLDSLIEEASNGIAYSLLHGTKERRKRSEEFVSTASRGDLVILLGENNHQYYSEVALKEKSLLVFQYAPELRQEAIQKQLLWNEEQGIYDEYEDILGMSDEELVGWVAPAYQLDMITDYCVRSIGGAYTEERWMTSPQKQELYDPVILSDEVLREKVLQALHQDQGVFDDITEALKFFREEDFVTLKDNGLALRIFPHIYRKAEEEVLGGGAEQMAQFVSHSTILQVSKDMYIGFDPHGRFVQVIQMEESHEGMVVDPERMPIQVASHLATMVFKDNQISPIGTAAALLVNWNFFTPKIQKEAAALGLGPYRGGLHMFFDQACFHAEQLGYPERLTPEFLNRLASQFNKEIEAAYEDFDYERGVVTEEKLHDFLISQYGHELISTQELLSLLKMCTPELMQSLEEVLQTRMTDLTTRETLAIASYLRKCNEGPACFRLIESILGESKGDARTHRLKVFVAQQAGLLDITDVQRLNTLGSGEERDRVYEKFAELLDSSEDTKLAGEQMGLLPEEIRAMGNRLLHKASELLKEASADIENTARKLTFISKDAALFASAFKSLKARGVAIDWEHIKNSSFERVSSAEVSPEDKEKMQHIWESYYAGKYDSRELEDSLRADFVKSFEKENVHFYLFKYKGEVASFFLSETVGEEDCVLHKHLASFMTSQSFEGGGLGLAVMEKGLEEEQKGAVLVGESDVDPVRTPIVSKYFEQYGFIATRAYDDHGEPTLALGRYENRTFEAKHMSRDYIKTFAEGGIETGRARYVVSDHVPDFQKHFTDGFVLTRYFVEKTPDEGVQYYSVFERSSEEMAVSGAR